MMCPGDPPFTKEIHQHMIWKVKAPCKVMVLIMGGLMLVRIDMSVSEAISIDKWVQRYPQYLRNMVTIENL